MSKSDVPMTFIISCVVLVPSFARATTCSLSNVTTNSVRLSWPNVKGATRYTFNYGSGNVKVSSDATSVNVNGLTPATNYKFLVTVYGQSGTGNTIACDGSTGKLSALTLSQPVQLWLYTLPYWSNPPFLIFDIRALWRPGLSAGAPECQKLKWWARPVWRWTL